MISALLKYLREQACPRWSAICFSTEAGLALLLAMLFAIFASRVAVGKVATGDVVAALLAYAAIAFGFSVAALTVALTAPDPEFTRKLAKTDLHSSGGKNPGDKSSYSNLLFIFSWTAIAHWAMVVVTIAVFIALGRKSPLLQQGASIQHRVGIGVLAFITIYALELFLVTVITLAQVGEAYIRSLRQSS